MKNIITALFLVPFFLLGAISNSIWNGFMFGWCWVDSQMHPDAWKIWEALSKSKDGK